MSGLLNWIICIVALGVVTLFATFFIIMGLHKEEIWQEIKKRFFGK